MTRRFPPSLGESLASLDTPASVPPARTRRSRTGKRHDGRPPVPLEKETQKAILAYLRVLGAFAVRVNSGMMIREYGGKRHVMRGNDQPGCPDIFACLVGLGGGRAVFIGIEVKRAGGKLTAAQASALDAIRKAGGTAFVATSVDEVKRALRAEGLIE